MLLVALVKPIFLISVLWLCGKKYVQKHQTATYKETFIPYFSHCELYWHHTGACV